MIMKWCFFCMEEMEDSACRCPRCGEREIYNKPTRTVDSEGMKKAVAMVRSGSCSLNRLVSYLSENFGKDSYETCMWLDEYLENHNLRY